MTAWRHAVAVSLALVVALPSAFVYAWALVHAPSPWLGVFLAFALGAGVGRAAAEIASRHHAPRATYAIGIAAIAYLASWLPWLSMTLDAVGHPAPLVVLVHPDVAWNALTLLYENGAWGIGARVIAGPMLALVWAGEVVIVLVSAALVGRD